ncbi:chromate efflux transporter [Thermostilla marina]
MESSDRHEPTTTTPPEAPARLSTARRLWDVTVVFTRLGCISFGGPATSIAMMEYETVERGRWLSRQDFLDLLGVTHLIPGPNAVEMSAHLGYRRAGFLGFLCGSLCFTLPAFLITLVLAIGYVRYGSLPSIAPWLAGIKPAVLAVILVAVVRLGRKAFDTPRKLILAFCVVAVSLAGLNEFYTVVAGTLLGLFIVKPSRRVDASGADGVPTDMQEASSRETPPADSDASASMWIPPLAVGTLGSTAIGLWSMFLFFMQVGCLMYGSGYVLLAYFDRGLVVPGIVSRAQLLDAVAAGQMTPGPLLTTATFLGYLLHGTSGAALATLGLLLPGVALMAVINPWVGRLRRSPWAARFLDTITVASIALMATVGLRLSVATLTSVPAFLLTATAIVVHVRWKVSPLWIVVGGAVCGYLPATMGW